MATWGKNKKKAEWEKYIGTMPSITEEQAAVSTPLSEYLAEAFKGAVAAPSFEDWAKTDMPDMFGGALGGQVQSYYAEALKGVTPDMFGGELGTQAQAAYEQAMSGDVTIPQEARKYLETALAPSEMFGGALGAETQAAYAEALRGVAPDVFGGALGAETQAAYGQAMTGKTPSEMFGGELGAEAKAAYAEALSGEFPEEYYQKSIYAPAMEEFRQDIMPAVKESYVGTGAITGTEVGERIGREAGRLQTGLIGTRAQLAEQAKQRSYQAAENYVQAFQQAEGANRNQALSAAGMYQTAYQSGQEQAKQRQLMAAGNYQQAYQSAVESAKTRAITAVGMYMTTAEQAKQRQLVAAGNYQQAFQNAQEAAKTRGQAAADSLQQYNLEYTKIAYDNYVRQNPAATEILQAALSYLNIPLMGVYQKPEPSGTTWGSRR